MIMLHILVCFLLVCNRAGYAEEIETSSSEGSLESENGSSTEANTDNTENTESSENIIRFLIMGDWGTQTKANSYSNKRLLENRNRNNNNNNNGNQGNGQNVYMSVLVAKAMATYASTYPADFLLALGDNFYNNGVSSVEDALWTTYYKDVYNYDSLMVPWYAILGNHDYGSNKGAGSTQAQLEYSDGRWHAGHCYMQSFTVPNTAVTVDIVFVDSTLLAPEETYQTSTASGLSAEDQSDRRQQQIDCLESYLAGSNAHYLLVAGHYPIFSTGKNGPGDMVSMKEVLLPYLLQYDVDAYLCGHDHFMEHLSYQYGGGKQMDFIISGAAGKPDNQLYSGAYCNATMRFAAATGGFTIAQISATELQLSFVDYNGEGLYTMTRKQSRQVQVQGAETGTGSSTGKAGSVETAESSITDGEDNEDETDTETLGEKLTQMKNYAKHTVSQMSREEMVEIGVLVGVLLSLVVMIFVVTSPQFNGKSRGKRARGAPAPFLEHHDYLKKLMVIEKINSEKKAAEKAANTAAASSDNPQNSNADEDKKPSSLRYIAASETTMDANWTRRQYYAARREALARTRPGRRRMKPPHPVLLHSNIHDAMKRPHTENIAGLSADFYV